MLEDYDVGYGKPPKHTRFEKGRSGNPKGRPKGGRNKGSVISNIIDRKVTIRGNGRKRKVTMFEALVESMTAKALRGSINDQIKLIQLIEKHAPEKLRDGRAKDQRVIVTFVDPIDQDSSVRGDGTGESGASGKAVHDNGRGHGDPDGEAAWRASGLADGEDETADG